MKIQWRFVAEWTALGILMFVFGISMALSTMLLGTVLGVVLAIILGQI